MPPESQIASIALGMIQGTIDLIEGCRLIVKLRFMMETQDDMDDEDLLFLIGVASETEDIPLGRERGLWSSTGLANKDAKLAEYLSRVRSAVLEACEALVKKYSSIEGIKSPLDPN